MLNNLTMAIATGLYAGKLPKCPGTWGSLIAILFWLPIKELPLVNYIILLIIIFVVGFFAAGSAEKILNKADAGEIVIDEILGMFITLMCAPNHPIAWLLGFIFFRFFDILKPYPVSWFDQKIHGGIGIMMDDVIAGIYALICLQLTWALYLKLI